MKYSATFGSFIRGGNYSLEAEYIFNSVEELLQWCALNQGILHDGLLKIVKTEDLQILYWCYNNEFYPLCDLTTFKNLEKLQEFIGKAETITDWIDDIDKQLHKGLLNILKELDLTLLSVGLNPSGYLDPVCMNDTNYLIGARSIIGCLKELDSLISKSATYSLKYEDNCIRLFSGDTKVGEIDATNFIKDGMVSDVRVDGTNLIIEFNTDAGKETIELPISSIVNLEDYATKESLNLLDSYVNSAVFVKYGDATSLNSESELRTQLDNRYITLEKFNKLFEWYEAD